MNEAEYLDTQDRILIAGVAFLGLPLDEFRQAIGRADAIGPVLNPTLYMTASQGLDAVRGLASAAARVHGVFEEHPGLLSLAAEAARRQIEPLAPCGKDD